MKRNATKLLIILMTLVLVFALVGCENLNLGFKKTLDTPTVSISEMGLASWQKVDNAICYVYKINGAAEKETSNTSIQLKNGESIEVKAKGDGKSFKDSRYSEKKTFNASYGATRTFDTPIVSINQNGVASWQMVTHASGYAYKINGGEERETTKTLLQLNEGESIEVKVKGDGETFMDSAFSEKKTFIFCENHLDKDNNNLCDACGMELVVKIDFYSVNDQHGVFCDTDANPGLDELTTYMKNAYADSYSYEILVSAGDMWQGTAESSLNKGAMMTEWMNNIGFSAMALGNHEYDWGSSYILENSKIADFPFLGINVSDTGVREDYCHPSTVVERGGVRVGIIGAIGNCLSSISGEFTSDGNLYFAVKNELTKLVKRESERLRNEEGCDFIVYLLHDGYYKGGTYNLSGNSFLDDSRTDLANVYYDTELSNGYVDLVIEGHSHQNYIITDEYGVKHLQSGGNNNYMGFVQVTFDRVSGSFDVGTVGKINSSVFGDKSIEDDPIIKELYSKYFPDPDNDPYTKVIGYNSKVRYSSEVLQTAAALYYQKGVSVWGNRYKIILAGGYMSARVGSIPMGNITYSSLYKMLPFDNALVLGKISGSKLKSQFINSTNKNYYIDYGGKTVYEGSIINSEYYYIVTDTYSAFYRYNGITPIEILYDNTYARDLLRDYISQGNWA